VLLDLQHRLAQTDAQAVLAAAAACVRRVLTVTGLDTRLMMAPTIDDALTWISSAAAQKPASTRAVTTGWCRTALRRYRSLRESSKGTPRSIRG
jgi:hypothetical protein